MDPFEVLGVARDATVEQVEERWRLLARRLHPDRYPGADEAERARLTTAMAELNEARRAVLAVLQRAASVASQAATGKAAAQHAPVPEPPPGAVRFVVGTIVGMLLLVILAVVMVVVIATGDERPAATTTPQSSAAPTVSSGPPTTLFVEWAIGACISAGEFVVPVDCGVSNAGRIVLLTTAPEICPDWAESFVRVDADVWCVDETG
ncbi:MAG: J domain-containing protein [Sphaerospermopsis kisseleviana]